MKWFQIITYSTPLISLLLCFSNCSNADTIYLDFNDESAAAGGGVTWNTVENSSITDLLDSVGNSTGISFDYTSGATFAESYSDGLSGAAAATWTNNAALDGFALLDLPGTESAQFEVSGLNNAVSYLVEFYVSTQSADLDVDIQIDGAFSDGGVSNDYSAQNNSSTVLTWTDITTGGDDSLVFNFALSNPTFFGFGEGASVNAIRITAIPEPSAASTYLGIVMLGSMIRRRRR